MYISNKIKLEDIKEEKAIFAREDIAKDEIIFEFEQKFIDHPTRDSLQVDEGKHQVSSKRDATENFINHSCSPNGYIDFSDMTFRALKKITKGEEITFNYNTTEWDMANGFECFCGEKNCLKKIKGFRYLNCEQRKKLKGKLSPFLKKKYQKECR